MEIRARNVGGSFALPRLGFAPNADIALQLDTPHPPPAILTSGNPLPHGSPPQASLRAGEKKEKELKKSQFAPCGVAQGLLV